MQHVDQFTGNTCTPDTQKPQQDKVNSAVIVFFLPCNCCQMFFTWLFGRVAGLMGSSNIVLHGT